MDKLVFLGRVGILGLLFLLVGCSQYKVYSVKESPKIPINGGVLYALPKTELCVSVTVERRNLANAPYAAFASEMIGVDNIDTNYRIVNIDVEGNNVADPDHFFFVKVRKGSLTVDRRHLLLAIGELKIENGERKIENGERKIENGELRIDKGEYNLYDRFDTLYTRYDKADKPSYVTSKKDSRSMRQRAVAAAEHLSEIQEKMQQLIGGEYEGSYGAESVKYIYSQLREQEQAIIASFCGEINSETVKMYVEPSFRRTETATDTLAWFSETEGLVFDIDAAERIQMSPMTPVVCTVQPDNDLRRASRFVKYHTSGVTEKGTAGRSGSAAAKRRESNNFRYRVPEMTSVSVSAATFSVSAQVPVLQLGPILTLPRHRVTAVFDPQTLDLIYYTRKR